MNISSLAGRFSYNLAMTWHTGLHFGATLNLFEQKNYLLTYGTC